MIKLTVDFIKLYLVKETFKIFLNYAVENININNIPHVKKQLIKLSLKLRNIHSFKNSCGKYQIPSNPKKLA